jgi:hypothetical protein
VADKKFDRDSVRKDIMKSLREVDDPDEYRDEWYKTEVGRGTSPEREALYKSPEGKKRRGDWESGAALGALGFMGQRLARRIVRGRAKEFTGIGAPTFIVSVGAGGGLNELRGAEKRRQEKKRRK